MRHKLVYGLSFVYRLHLSRISDRWQGLACIEYGLSMLGSVALAMYHKRLMGV